MRTTKLLFVLLFVILTSCLSKDEKSETLLPNHVVLIFKGFPKNYRLPLIDPTGTAYTPARPEIRYYDEHSIERIFKPKPETTDTVVITCSQKSIEFRHHYAKGFDTFEYVFNKGDTVVFTYVDKIPTAKIVNRIVSDFETNYDLKQREFVCNNDYPALMKITMPFMFITHNVDYIGKEGERSGFFGQFDNVKHNAEIRFKKELENEKRFLDSLLSESLISNEGYYLFIQKLKIKETVEKAYNDLVSRNDVKIIIPEDFDSLLNYHSYRGLINTVSSTFYDRKVKRIITSNSNLQDYRIVYDSILQSNLFSDKAKQILLFETSDWLIQNNKATDINKHIEKVKRDIKDTVLISYLIDKYELKNQVSNELQLTDINGNKTTLSTIIKSNTNKVIYVDFWASWCGPCIGEFPQSKLLAEKLKGKNIEFIYLSIDEESNKWMTSSKKHLPGKHSFLIKNVKTSKFLENIDLSSVPRYLIFDKAGNLKYENGPKPSDSETVKILRELM